MPTNGACYLLLEHLRIQQFVLVPVLIRPFFRMVGVQIKGR